MAGIAKIIAHAPLVVLGNGRPFHFIAFVEESYAEPETDVVKDLRVLSPGQHRTRRHQHGDVTVHESFARQVCDRHHVGDDSATVVTVLPRTGLAVNDVDFDVVRQVVQRRHDVPTIHLPLVDLLSTVIETSSVAKPDCVGR